MLDYFFPSVTKKLKSGGRNPCGNAVKLATVGLVSLTRPPLIQQAAFVAQLGERTTEVRDVAGSIPAEGNCFFLAFFTDFHFFYLFPIHFPSYCRHL